jgi:alanyl-tRNA synthetase
MRIREVDEARAEGDRFRLEGGLGVLAIATEDAEGRRALFTFVTDELIGRGVRAGDLIRDMAAVAGGRGGGRPHMAQGGVEDPSRVDAALRQGEVLLRSALGGT